MRCNKYSSLVFGLPNCYEKLTIWLAMDSTNEDLDYKTDLRFEKA